MKICLAVTNELTTDYRVFKEAAALAAKHEVIALGFLRNNTKPKEKKDSFTIVRVKEPLLRRIFVRLKSAREFVTDAQIQTFKKKGPIKRVLSSLRDTVNDVIMYNLYIGRDRSIYRGLKGIDADVYQANDLDTLKACVRIAKKRGAKVVYDSHELCVEEGFINTRFFKWLLSLREKKYVRRCDAVITVNQPIASILKRKYGLKALPHIIKNYPEYEETRYEKHTGKTKKIIFIGILAPNRGLEELIVSMKYIDGAELHLRGFGTAKESLERLAKKEGVEKKVKFLGSLPPNELVRTSTFADIGVMPYKADFLGLKLVSPNKIYIYMMCGLAVAASNLPEIKKTVNESNTGVLFNSYSPKDIAKSISKLISDEKLLERCRMNSLQAAKKYNWGIEGKRYFEIYESIEND